MNKSAVTLLCTGQHYIVHLYSVSAVTFGVVYCLLSVGYCKQMFLNVQVSIKLKHDAELMGPIFTLQNYN